MYMAMFQPYVISDINTLLLMENKSLEIIMQEKIWFPIVKKNVIGFIFSVQINYHNNNFFLSLLVRT